MSLYVCLTAFISKSSTLLCKPIFLQFPSRGSLEILLRNVGCSKFDRLVSLASATSDCTHTHTEILNALSQDRQMTELGSFLFHRCVISSAVRCSFLCPLCKGTSRGPIVIIVDVM